MDQVSQTSQAPTSGASNAEDFQPLTQNPQSVGGNLQQPGTTGQDTSSQDILTNQNARIVVPKNPAPVPVQAASQTTSMNWWPVVWVVLLTGIFIWIIVYFVMRKTRKQADPASEDAFLPEENEPISIPITENTTQPKPTPKKSKPKKSKSKRKKSRK